MHIVSVESERAHPTDTPENFSGRVRMQRIQQTKEARSLDLVAVFFEAGARTRPHVHATDQFLHVVDGEGIVATENERRLIRRGDIILIRAGEWHWHGATATSPMCHVSARPGGPTDWSAPLRDWETYMQGVRG